jgi:hypothetical protein
MNHLVNTDIFFDPDVLYFLKSIRESSGENYWEVIQDEESGLCFLYDQRRGLYTNYYNSHLVEMSEYEKIKDLKERIISLNPAAQVQFRVSSNILEEEIDKELKDSRRELDWSKEEDPVNVIVGLENFSLKSIKSSNHRKNIKKAQKLGVKSKCYYREQIPDHILKEFYDCCVTSRKNIGKAFTHNLSSFLIRAQLSFMGKAILCRTEYEGKVSYVYTLVSENNALYYDSGYNKKEDIFTGHFAQYKIMQKIKSLGGKFYSMGILPDKKKYEIETLGSGKTTGMEYYKYGFSKHSIKEYIVR